MVLKIMAILRNTGLNYLFNFFKLIIITYSLRFRISLTLTLNIIMFLFKCYSKYEWLVFNGKLLVLVTTTSDNETEPKLFL